MPHVYTVTLQDQRTVMHVEAKSAHEAKRIALNGVEVKRLNGSEILDLTRRGIAIVSAETGEVCNSAPDGDTETVEVCEGNDPTCGPVTHHDSEGVPLCDRCWDELEPLPAGAED